jgi:hypothetical protein
MNPCFLEHSQGFMSHKHKQKKDKETSARSAVMSRGPSGRVTIKKFFKIFFRFCFFDCFAPLRGAKHHDQRSMNVFVIQKPSGAQGSRGFMNPCFLEYSQEYVNCQTYEKNKILHRNVMLYDPSGHITNFCIEILIYF